MKKLVLLSLLALAACKKESTVGNPTADSTVVDTTLVAPPAEERALKDTTETVAPERTTANPEESVTGNFTGKNVTAIATLIHEGTDSEDPAQYSITFNDPAIAAVPGVCCGVLLVNEGDLNGDGNDELGVANAPLHGCTYDYQVYTYKNGKWLRYLESFLIPTACDGIDREKVQELVFKEGNTVYYMKTDVNNEDFKKIKTKAKVLVK
ncbi:hypothetical protein ACLI08_01505 [Flavobacterium sp. RNTU_13]|uniref:hypothetical protein n=1 Tax=Flavobacterium sp. RNTU_13 TaxID=3375145 RepID=UPI003986601F